MGGQRASQTHEQTVAEVLRVCSSGLISENVKELKRQVLGGCSYVLYYE